jgi:hypothetical protein
MRFVRAVLLVVTAVALAAYGFDCLAMTAPEQAMQCSNSMPCMPNSHHGQDCCKTMPSVQTAFLQPSAGHTPSLTDVATVIVSEFPDVLGTHLVIPNTARVSHPPPIADPQASSPIRI